MKVKEAVSRYKILGDLCTYQDYLELPDDGNRYEIIEGELIMPPAPLTLHQKISRNIVYELLKFNENEQAGEILYAPVDVVLSQTNVIQPDVLFILNENCYIITEDNIDGAPDLVFEIISPSTGDYDLIKKKNLYEKFGIKEYWIIDPTRQRIEIYLNVQNKFELQQRMEQRGIVKSIILTGFQLGLDRIFGV